VPIPPVPGEEAVGSPLDEAPDAADDTLTETDEELPSDELGDEPAAELVPDDEDGDTAPDDVDGLPAGDDGGETDGNAEDEDGDAGDGEGDGEGDGDDDPSLLDHRNGRSTQGLGG
jgi:hypothetical protein